MVERVRPPNDPSFRNERSDEQSGLANEVIAEEVLIKTPQCDLIAHRCDVELEALIPDGLLPPILMGGCSKCAAVC